MIYNLAIYIYVSAVRLAALFSKKVSKMVKGEQEAFTVLKQKIDPQAKYIWFHAASLGEFEQGRPLIELIRKRFPQYRILQTFFSPSGYEVRKDYKGADVVCYLPLDTPRNVRRFIDAAPGLFSLVWGKLPERAKVFCTFVCTKRRISTFTGKNWCKEYHDCRRYTFRQSLGNLPGGERIAVSGCI